MLSVNELEDRLIDLAFAEDIGDGDHTTLCCIPETAMGKSHLLIKEDGILAGVEVAKRVFARFDPEMKVEVLIGDGAHVRKGDIAMVVSGKVRSLLQTAPHAQHHAAHEWHRHYDQQVRGASQGHQHSRPRHP